MKILVLTVTILNFVVYFPYNGSQAIHCQTNNEHLSASLPLSSSDSPTESQHSSVLRTEENSAPTDYSNSYSESTDRATRISQSFTKRKHSENSQSTTYNFPTFEVDEPTKPTTNQTSASFTYVKGRVDNSTREEAPKSNASPSSDIMPDTSVISNTTFGFAPNSKITQSRMTISGENSSSAPVSRITQQYKSNSTVIPHFQTDSKATQKLQYFFSSNGRSKPFIAPISAAYIPDATNEFVASADDSTIVISNVNDFFGIDTTTQKEKTEPDSVIVTDTITLMKEDHRAKIDATDILEDYTTPPDVLYIVDKNIITIDNAYLERHSKSASNAPDLPKKDKHTVIDVRNKRNDGRNIINIQTSSISSTKNSSDFESAPILNTNEKNDTKSMMIVTDIDEAISNINPINSTNTFLNYIMYMKSSNNRPNDTKIISAAKNTLHVEDLIISQTNGTTSKKYNINSKSTETATNTNINHKIMWPSREDMIKEDRHTVQMKKITPPNKNNDEAIGSKVRDSIIEYHSNIPANIHLKTERNNFKSSSTYGIENVVPVVQEFANTDKNDGVVEEVIFIYPDTSTTEIRKNIYSHNPEADYAQRAGKKTIHASNASGIFNSIFKYKIKSFTMDSTKLNSRNHMTPATINANHTTAKSDAQRTTMFNRVNFNNSNTPIISITHPGYVDSTYFNEDSDADNTSVLMVNITPSDKSADSVVKTISIFTSKNHTDGVASLNSEMDFPMNNEYTLLSVTESSVLIPNVQNNQAQTSFLAKNDSLIRAWTTDPLAENPHLFDDATLQKWKISKLSADPFNISFAPTSRKADFTSSKEEYNSTTSAASGTTFMTNSSELSITKATMPERRSSVPITSMPTKTAGIFASRNRSLIDKKLPNGEVSTFYAKEPEEKEDNNFQIKENLPENNFSYFESGDGDSEQNVSVAVDTTKFHSKLSSIVPTAEETVSDRELIIPRKENGNALYDVNNPTSDKIYFKLLTTKGAARGLGKSSAMKQNLEPANGAEFLPPSNSISQTRKMDYPTRLHSYYSLITNNSLNITKENLNVAKNTMKQKQSLSTTDNANHIYYSPVAMISSEDKRDTNKRKITGTKVTNILPGNNIVADISYKDNNTEVVTGLASTAYISPIKENIMTINEVNTLNNKSNKLGDDFTISINESNVSRDDETPLIADSSLFIKSVAPLNHPQATNIVKNTSSADIIMPTIFHNRSTQAALEAVVTTTFQGDVDTMFSIPRYESESSFKKDTTLNYEANPKKDIGIMADSKDVLQEENVRARIIPITSGKGPKGNNSATKHYSVDSNGYNPTRFKKIAKAPIEFENPASSYISEVSKPLPGKITLDFQEKMITKNDAKHDVLFSTDIPYPMTKEKVPKGYIISPATPDFRNPTKDNIKTALEGIVLLGKNTSSKKYAPYTDTQTDPGAENDQIAKGSITKSNTSIIPVTFSTPISTEDIHVENYYHRSVTGTPLSLAYASTLTDDAFILGSKTILLKENNLDDKSSITESNKSDSEYISNTHTFELEKKELSSLKKPLQFTPEHSKFVSYTPSSKGEDSNSVVYRITHPEFKTKEKYQTSVLKEENSHSDIFATSFKDYTTNLPTQHLKTMAPSLNNAGETHNPKFLERSFTRQGTLRKDDTLIILPELFDLQNKKPNNFFVPQRETIAMKKSSTFNAVPTNHGVITTPIKGKYHLHKKDMSSNLHNRAVPELADTIISENSKVNEDKRDLTEETSAAEYINPMAQDVASPAKNVSNTSEVSQNVIKTASITSLSAINARKIPTNATTASPTTLIFDSRKSNEDINSTMPTVNGSLSKKSQYILIPNQKQTRILDDLSENDHLSAISTILEVSESLDDQSTISGQNREITKVQSDPESSYMVSSAPLVDPVTFLIIPKNTATGTSTTENGDVSDKTDTTALRHIIPQNGGRNKTSDYDIGHHENHAVISPSAEENSTLGIEANALLSKGKTVVEDESYISEANIPMNERDRNSVNINAFIIKSDVASAEKKASGTLKETYYPDFPMNTIKLTKARVTEPFSLDGDNLERFTINFYNKLDPLPVESILPPTDFETSFIKISHSELDPVLIIEENNREVIDNSITAKDIIVLPENEIISPNDIDIDNIRNTINGKSYIDSTQKDNAILYEVIHFTKDFSEESDEIFPAGENNPKDMDLMTIVLEDSNQKHASEGNIFHDEEEKKSPTAKIPTVTKNVNRFRSHTAFSTEHTTENPLNENSAEPKTKQKFQMLISRKGYPGSVEDSSFLKYYTTKFNNKSPKAMTHSLTNRNRIFSSEFPDDSVLGRSTLSINDIRSFPGGKLFENIPTPKPESMESVGERWISPGETTDNTVSSDPITNEDKFQNNSISSTGIHALREAKPILSPKSEYNQNKTFTVETYHSQDVTASSCTFNINLDNELLFDDEDSEDKKSKASTSFSPMKTIYTITNTTVLSLENSYKEGNPTQLDGNNTRARNVPFQITTESILVPKDLTENSALLGNNLTDSSKLISTAAETITEYLDLINKTNVSENQDSKIQMDIQTHSLDSIISTNSRNFPSHSTENEADSPSTLKRETADISKIKADTQPQGKMMKVPSPRQISPFLSEKRKKSNFSSEEDASTKFYLSHFTNSTVLIPKLEKTHPLSPEPSAFSKSYNNEEKVDTSESGNSILKDSRTLKDSFFDKFVISDRLQDPTNLKRIISAYSTRSQEKTVKPLEKNSIPPNEDTGTTGLLHDVLTGLLRKPALTPDFTSVNSSKYSELDLVVKTNNDTTTKTNRNIPFEERNTPSHKDFTSPNTSILTRDMLKTIFSKRYMHRNLEGKDKVTEYEIVPIKENISDIVLDDENIPNNEDVIRTMLDNRSLKYVSNENVLEPQEGKNTIIQNATLSFDPSIIESHPFYSSSESPKHLSQGAPTEIKAKETLQNLVSREEHNSSDLQATVLKISTDHLNSKTPRSMIYPFTQTRENFHKFVDKTTLQNDTHRDDTITILPEDKRLQYTMVPDIAVTATMIEGKMSLDELNDPTVITSALKNKNQFHNKFILSATYNTDAKDKAKGILHPRRDNVKGKTSMSMMPDSHDTIITLTEFNVIPGNLLFINEDTEILSTRASTSSTPMNRVHTVDDTITLTTASSYEGGDSVHRGKDNINSRGLPVIHIPEIPRFIPNDSTENLKLSDTTANNSLSNHSVSRSIMFEKMIKYLNSINYDDIPLKNKTDPRPYFLTSLKLTNGSTTFSDNSTENEFDSVSSVNRETTNISKIETNEIHFGPQRTIMKIFSPLKISHSRIYEERKKEDLSNQRDTATKPNLSHYKCSSPQSSYGENPYLGNQA